MDIIPHSEILLRLLLTLVIAFFLGLERELKHQPAGIRTHVLIWVGSCLLMILSILVPEMYNSNINDPGRIAAQVVSGIWFLGAWAIIKLWVDTRGLTTAANIWVTAAIGLVIGAGLYFAAFAAAIIIFIDLILVTEFKKRFIISSRFCTIELWFPQKDNEAQKVYKGIKKLPLDVLSKHIKEDKKNIHLKVIAKIRRDEDLFAIKNNVKLLTKYQKISVSESVKTS